jgi:hypothetical protein
MRHVDSKFPEMPIQKKSEYKKPIMDIHRKHNIWMYGTSIGLNSERLLKGTGTEKTHFPDPFAFDHHMQLPRRGCENVCRGCKFDC